MKIRWLCTFFLLALLQHAAAQAPVAAFTSSNPTGCAPLRVNFTDQSTGDPKYWSWDFGNGEFSNLQNPSVSYATPGTYDVTLTVRNGNGANAMTKTGYIIVTASPVANFTTSSTLACAPATISFTDQSNPNGSPIRQWAWDFGDGTTSNAASPSKVYAAPGFYNVSLKVTTEAGCVSSRTIGPIRITGGVTADFSFNAPPTCRPPFTVNFNNQTSGPGTLTYQWTFGNSTGSTLPNPPATFAASGTYTVSLTARSSLGCSDTKQKTVTINTTATDFTAPASGCLNVPVSFTNNSTPVSTVWDFGDGNSSVDINASHAYSAPGTYSVKMINTYTECKDSITKTIVVPPDPEVNFTAPVTGACQAPFTVNFRDISPDAVAWAWNFGDGNSSTAQHPSYTYTTEGNFNVGLTITNSNGCKNTLTQSSFVTIRKPVITIQNLPTGGCAPFSYNNPRATVDAPDGVASWNWNFGNGVTSSLQNPASVPYPTPGRYTVSLTVTTRGGCTVTRTVTDGVKVGTPIPASFTASATDVCVATGIQFTNQTSPSDEWSWNFGDGNFSSDPNPLHSYARPGTYEVRLTSYNNRCPTVSAPMSITVRPPLASFTKSVNCANKGMVTFTNTSETDVALGAISYHWDFGSTAVPSTFDGETPPAVRFPAAGEYTVSLTVTNGSCSNTYSEKVHIVTEMADFEVTPTSVCYPSPVHFKSTNNPANIASYSWHTGGTLLSASPAFNSAFPPGTYPITLEVTDVNGCVTNKTRPSAFTIIGAQANFRPASTNACKNVTVSFNDLTLNQANIASWVFDFGDGTTSTFTAPPFTHKYSDTGIYVVKLTVTTKDNCSHTFESPEHIHVTSPVPGFEADYRTVCPGAPVQFRDTSWNGLNFRWDFGDGTGATIQAPQHSFNGNEGDMFSIKQVVTNAHGCSDSVTTQNYISLKKPKPGFIAKDTISICPPLETKFTLQATDYETFSWSFGDGGGSSLENPTYFYNNYGTYTAKLYTYGIGGCVDSASAIVQVFNPNTDTNIDFPASQACDSLTVDFTITTPPHTDFQFFFGDGAIDNSQNKNLRHQYTSPANYRPAMVLSDNLGCRVTVGAVNTIQILGAEVIFGMDRKRFCDDGVIFFTDYTRPRLDPIQTREWDFGDNTTSTDANPSHRYAQPGTYYPKLTARTNFGCNSNMVDTVRVYRTPDPLIDAPNTVCLNSELTLEAGLAVADTAISWKWDPGGNTESTTIRYTQPGSYTVKLEASNLLGCKGNTTKSILVPPLPQINFSEQPVIPVGGNIQIPVSYTGSNLTYNWTPASTLSCTDCPMPVAAPKSTTKYFVRVKDEYGCDAVSDVTVTVVCNEKNYFVPNTFSPNNDGHNDIFYPRGSYVTRISTMKIFNRWGEQLFERRDFSANDKSKGWDGTYKGKPADPGVYIFLIEFICENGSIVPYRGNLTLLR